MKAIPAIGAPLRAHPTPLFFNLRCKQKHLLNFTQGRPLRGAWVALGWPLGHPSVTQSQSQSQAGSGLQRVHVWLNGDG